MLAFAELMEGWLRDIGSDHVGLLCTDNAAAMRLAREKTVKKSGLTDIAELR